MADLRFFFFQSVSGGPHELPREIPHRIAVFLRYPCGRSYPRRIAGEPAVDSPRYTKPFTLLDDTTLKAKAFCDGYSDTRLMVADFRKVVPRLPVKTGALAQGIDYGLYYGSWDMLPDFGKITPVKRGIIDTFTLPPGVPEDNFAVLYKGYISIAEDGAYTFYTSSDDGSRLYIGDSCVVDNDGLHGFQEKETTIALKAGIHEITVEFFEKGGGQDMEVSYRGPGIEKQEIGSSVLRRNK